MPILLATAVSLAASTSPLTAASPNASPAPAYADTLRVGWRPGGAPPGFRGAEFTTAWPSISYGTAVYSGLYRYDARFEPVPDLADGPCFVPGSDPRVIRCRIVATTFHDGTPVTADDVAYSHTLETAAGGPNNLVEARPVDQRTVDFVLSKVDPAFLTVVLPTGLIYPRRTVEASYADFVARTVGLTGEHIDELVTTIGEELARDPPVCTTRLDEVDALLDKLGTYLYREEYEDANGQFDPCAYLARAATVLSYAADAIRRARLDARWSVLLESLPTDVPLVGERLHDVLATSAQRVHLDAVFAAVLVLLPTFDRLPGTGPYRFVSETPGSVHLEAFAGYHGGVPATRYLDFVMAEGDGSDLAVGRLDVFQGADRSVASRIAVAERDLRVASAPGTIFTVLTFNTRPGRLFADVALRRALQLCIDLPRDIDASTGGDGTPIYGPVMLGSWADDPDLPKPRRDVAAARQLIDGSGWTEGPDGVYAKDSARLAARILVRANNAQRIQMADLIAHQARECGMDLGSSPMDFAGLNAMMTRYPHDIPGTTTPFDLTLMAWMSPGADPSTPMSGYISSEITDAAHGDRMNFGGFSDPAYDRLVAAGGATYDQAERARIYRAAQQELAAEVPAIFLWAVYGSDILRSAVVTIDGPLDLSAPNWAWQLERLVVAAAP